MDGEGSADTGAQRSWPALLAAGVILVAVVAVVMVFGVARPPALPTIGEQPSPAPSASLAWSTWTEEGDCLQVIEPDGRDREVGCPGRGEELLAWDDDGMVLRSYDDVMQIVWIDPVSGDERDRQDAPEDLRPSSAGNDVVARTEDGTLTVRLREDDTILWEVDAHEGYRINQGVTSPDGRFVALVDEAGRLLVVPTDGQQPPRVWHEDVSPWITPVWEGTPLRQRG